MNFDGPRSLLILITETYIRAHHANAFRDLIDNLNPKVPFLTMCMNKSITQEIIRNFNQTFYLEVLSNINDEQ